MAVFVLVWGRRVDTLNKCCDNIKRLIIQHLFPEMESGAVQFLQRVGIACYASAVYATAVSAVRPSVRPSITFRCIVETNEATIMRFSPTGRAIILVSGEVKIVWKFARDHP